jgi:hypothetical protein
MCQTSGINRRGGKRVRQPEKNRVHWSHPDAWLAYAVSKLETSTAVQAGNKENQPLDLDAQVEEDEGEDCFL